MVLHKLASLLLRDYTIMAKRHYDMARDCRAIAGTWRQALDDTVPDVLHEQSREDGVLGAPLTPADQELQVALFVDDTGRSIT